MSVHITAGSLHRKTVPIPDIKGLRPTSSKVREALFSMLGNIQNKTFLDLFSGSGLMGLEALSRGAIVTSVESSNPACRAQQKLKNQWELTHWTILQGQVETQLRQLNAHTFDIIFADPPYNAGWCQHLPLLISQHHIQTTQLVLEECAKVQPIWPTPWQCIQSRRYGQTKLHFLG